MRAMPPLEWSYGTVMVADFAKRTSLPQRVINCCGKGFVVLALALC